MKIIDQDDGKLIVISGDSLAGESAGKLKETALKLIEQGVKKIKLDLSSPNYIDSSGIGKLLFINKKIEKLGGEFSICAINTTLYEFLESLALNKVMEIAEPGDK